MSKSKNRRSVTRPPPNGAAPTSAATLRRAERLVKRGYKGRELAVALRCSSRHAHDLRPIAKWGVPALRQAVIGDETGVRLPVRVGGRIARMPQHMQERVLRCVKNASLNAQMDHVRAIEVDLRRARPGRGRRPSRVVPRLRTVVSRVDAALVRAAEADPSNAQVRAGLDILSVLRGEISIDELLQRMGVQRDHLED